VSDQKIPLDERVGAGRRRNARLSSSLRAHGTGRLASPGQLLNPDAGVAVTETGGVALAEYAVEHGLRPSAQRPTIWNYVIHLWRRRHFMIAFATARNIAMYTEAKLGQLWQVLTPLLNVGVYWLIFGVILDTSKGVPDFVSFLVVGVFVFNFTQRAFISTSKVITDSLPLIRALQFPRAALPLAYVIIELQQMLISMIVLVAIILVRGEPVTWYWLLAIPALILQAIFNVGCGLFVARLGSQVNDFSQLLPFLLRTWMYLSGVLFSVLTLARTSFGEAHKGLVVAMQLNPASLYITLMRLALLQTQRQSAPGYAAPDKALCDAWPGKSGSPANYYSKYCVPTLNPDHYWYYAGGWALLALVAGFFFFWRAETRYGRG
jgi:teichoic acid transport system permease protein